VIQIGSSSAFALARDIDPGYGRAFDRAREAGVQAIAYTCRLNREEAVLARPVPILS
jgi:sugar fermentation stimulation protein A